MHKRYDWPASCGQLDGRLIEGPFDLRDPPLGHARRSSIRKNEPRLDPLRVDLRKDLERCHAAANEPDCKNQDRGGARQHYEPVLDRPFESGGIRSLHKPLQALITVPLQELQGGQERPQRREQELEESQHETVVVGEVPRQHKECLGERHEHCGDERKGHHRDELPHHAGDE